jgi:signal transduction histidine kinase/CheY-like chemotaxis protein
MDEQTAPNRCPLLIGEHKTMMISLWWTRLTHHYGADELQRRLLLLFCLLGAGANSLFFYFIRPLGYEPQANLWAAMVFFTWALLVPMRHAYTVLSNLALTTAVVLMAYVTAHTGGINSSAMVWMTIIAVLALLLLGRRWALFWLLMVLLVFVLELLAVSLGWIDGQVVQTPKSLVWSLLDKVLVITSLTLVVTFYDRMHLRQMEEVQQRNDELERTQRALKRAQSHKDEFIASVGHELRTPMNAILGLNGVLLTELAEQPENVQIAQHIGDSTRQLLRLVNDILDFSQLQAGQLSLMEKPLHLDKTLRRLVAELEARAAEKSLQLHCTVAPDLPDWVLLDGQRLEQILNKLLDNALKFTARGSVRLSAHAMQNRMVFEVEDTGCGIAQEHQQQIFKRFEHADMQTKSTYGGTGLGLAICERLVSLQGGRMGVRSQPEQGALFWFDLPLQPATSPDAVRVRPLSEVPSSLRILLVDDNVVNLMVAQLVLKKCWPDAHITQANSGQAALDCLDEQTFELVLMDMVMPELNGLETTRRLRQHTREEVAQVLVVGLTASTLVQERNRCLQSGMDEVLAKPIDASAVKDVITRLLEQRTLVPKTPPAAGQGYA